MDEAKIGDTFLHLMITLFSNSASLIPTENINYQQRITMIVGKINFMPPADNVDFYWPQQQSKQAKVRIKREVKKGFRSWSGIRGTNSESFRSVGEKMAASGQQRPSFDDRTKRNVTVPLGSVAFLQCKINNLGDRIVSIFRLLNQSPGSSSES